MKVLSAINSLFIKIKSHVTIEPVLILYFLTSVAIVGQFHFMFEKACAAKLHEDESVCETFHKFQELGINCAQILQEDENSTDPGISTRSEAETDDLIFKQNVCDIYGKSVSEIVDVKSYKSIITGVIQIIILLFAGSWSDRVGRRKPCILISIVADMLSNIVYILSSLFMSDVPLEVASILPEVISAVTGGSGLLILSICSYISLTTKEEDRTFKFAYITVTITIIPIICIAAGGWFYNRLGFTNLCILCIILDICALLYGIFFLKEPQQEEVVQLKGADNPAFENNEISRQSTLQLDAITVDIEKTVEINFFQEFFDPTLVKDLYRMIVKKREHSMRTILFLVAFVYFINFGAAGDNGYAEIIAKARFNWNSEIGYWKSYDQATTTIGTLLAIGLLSKYFAVTDPLICVFSVIFTLISKPIMIYAVVAILPNLFFVATSIDVFEGSRLVAIRSMVSKFVGADDIAKMFSILAIVEAAESTIFPTIYGILYQKTEASSIGATYCFILSGVILLVSLAIYIVIYVMMKRIPKLDDLVPKTAVEGTSNVNTSVTSL